MNENAQNQVTEWYQKYSNDIYQYILFMTGDHERSKDMMQETFLRAYDHLSSFQGNNAKGWLFRIARNITIDSLRKEKPIAYLFDQNTYVVSNNVSPEKITILNEVERELYHALGQLKMSYRDVIVLRKIKGFSIQESSNILGWKESKVKSTLLRALKALKRQLEKEGYNHETI
ncbi:sigma-70 family RNA polymerase sigma factor [Evansella sp. AB-P1]|uniref:RNA polymerase sigma factor n=1 Tax=Evansella sp. AB-P1 TaxID=3037653 RepID=UPI00241C9508|nr:sigma-70 family RNA polymerase sigma factor [Evansella sp. AB-P1]MDG5789612.1 sigma-70 family RNA polymerase sigma factor [Evansella sp. AB-P1]